MPVRNYTVFGRVTPDQKRKLIRAFKAGGHTVAMTGDGVNDVLALKDADCSIAMASGSDVACQVAQLVLMDSNFAAMPSIVAEGRRVINNIERSASLFLTKNIFSFALTLTALIAALKYPITPSQLSLFNMTLIGIPSFIFALEQNTSMVRGRFLLNALLRALPAGLTDFLALLGTILACSYYQRALRRNVHDGDSYYRRRRFYDALPDRPPAQFTPDRADHLHDDTVYRRRTCIHQAVHALTAVSDGHLDNGNRPWHWPFR